MWKLHFPTPKYLEKKKNKNKKALRNIRFLIHSFLYLYFFPVSVPRLVKDLLLWILGSVKEWKQPRPEAPSAVFLLYSSHRAGLLSPSVQSHSFLTYSALIMGLCYQSTLYCILANMGFTSGIRFHFQSLLNIPYQVK